MQSRNKAEYVQPIIEVSPELKASLLNIAEESYYQLNDNIDQAQYNFSKDSVATSVIAKLNRDVQEAIKDMNVNIRPFRIVLMKDNQTKNYISLPNLNFILTHFNNWVRSNPKLSGYELMFIED